MALVDPLAEYAPVVAALLETLHETLSANVTVAFGVARGCLHVT